MGYFPSPGWSLAIIFSSAANQSAAAFLAPQEDARCMCGGGFLVKGRKSTPYTGILLCVPRCRLVGGQGQILPGIGVGKWDIGEGEPEVAQVAWKSWQI